MNTAELSEHLRTASAGLAPPPGFAGAVLRGGRRRRARRRLTIAASVVAVVAVATSATVVSLRDDDAVQAADARLAMPTKGDLAGDEAFLYQAARAWQDGLPSVPEARDRYYDDRRGDPHVYWAGTTPAGNAAIVLQQVYVHPNSQVTERGLRTAEGLVAVDPADGRLKVVGTRVIGQEQPGDADYYKFGDNDRTMLMVDQGIPIHYSFTPALVEEPGGNKVRFDWQRARPADGVAVVTVPANRQATAAIAYQGGNPPELVPVGDVPFNGTRASLYLNQRLPDPGYRLPSELLVWGDATWTLGEPIGLTPTELDQKWGLYRYDYFDHDYAVGLWTIAVGLPGGRVVVLKESQNGEAKPRLTAKIAPNRDAYAAELLDGGLIDRDAVLPVRFRLPDGGGLIVADKGKELRYRTSPDAPWQDAGRDAALLPGDVTEVLAGDRYVRLD